MIVWLVETPGRPSCKSEAKLTGCDEEALFRGSCGLIEAFRLDLLRLFLCCRERFSSFLGNFWRELGVVGVFISVFLVVSFPFSFPVTVGTDFSGTIDFSDAIDASDMLDTSDVVGFSDVLRSDFSDALISCLRFFRSFDLCSLEAKLGLILALLSASGELIIADLALFLGELTEVVAFNAGVFVGSAGVIKLGLGPAA